MSVELPSLDEVKSQYNDPWEMAYGLAEDMADQFNQDIEQKDAQIQELEGGWERYQILREVVASSTDMDEDELDQLVEQRRTEDEG